MSSTSPLGSRFGAPRIGLSVLLLLLVAVSLIGPVDLTAQDRAKAKPFAKDAGLKEATKVGRPIVIAHRGASGYLPEHTLAAYAYAHAVGADFIEQDVVLTRDALPIVLHDVQLEAVTNVRDVFPDRARKNGAYYAIDFTLEEIKTLRVRERTTRNGKQSVFPSRFPQASCDFRVPTLAEAIELVNGLNKSAGRTAGIYPEIKRPAWHREQGLDISRIVVEVLGRHGYREESDRCFVQCFEASETKRIRNELGCNLQLVQLISGREGQMTSDALNEIAEYANGIGPAMSLVVKGNDQGDYSITDLTRLAHEAGLVVHPYTLRADELPGFAESFPALVEILEVEAGVDGFFTDFPDQALSALSERSRQVTR